MIATNDFVRIKIDIETMANETGTDEHVKQESKGEM